MPDLSPEQSVSCPENLKAEAVEKAVDAATDNIERSLGAGGVRQPGSVRAVAKGPARAAVGAVADDLYEAGYVRALADAEERIEKNLEEIEGQRNTDPNFFPKDHPYMRGYRASTKAALAALKEGKQA